MERSLPTQEEVVSYLKDRRNWGRWGNDDEVGAIDLVTPEKGVAAAGLVRSGRSVSLSMPFPKTPGPGNPTPAQHSMNKIAFGTGGAAMDFYGIYYHGYHATHLDALCHIWDSDAMWNGRDPANEIDYGGARFGGVEKWRDGISTRGVLLDVPRHRGKPYVTSESPVHGWELEDSARSQGVSLEPGDALVVYCGRGAWQADHPTTAYGPAEITTLPYESLTQLQRPGLHASCLPFIRDHDASVLVWDMQYSLPIGYDVTWSVHGVILAYGVAILNNALLGPLARACAEEGRYEFMLTIAPLNVEGGTGSPVNPIALF